MLEEGLNDLPCNHIRSLWGETKDTYWVGMWWVVYAVSSNFASGESGFYLALAEEDLVQVKALGND
jgi:hypothetical protein